MAFLYWRPNFMEILGIYVFIILETMRRSRAYHVQESGSKIFVLFSFESQDEGKYKARERLIRFLVEPSNLSLFAFSVKIT